MATVVSLSDLEALEQGQALDQGQAVCLCMLPNQK